MIGVSNIVSAQTGKGMVSIELDGKLIARLDIDNAEKFARDVMRCASIAECEASLIRFLSEKVKRPLEECAVILAEFREYRKE